MAPPARPLLPPRQAAAAQRREARQCVATGILVFPFTSFSPMSFVPPSHTPFPSPRACVDTLLCGVVTDGANPIAHGLGDLRRSKLADFGCAPTKHRPFGPCPFHPPSSNVSLIWAGAPSGSRPATRERGQRKWAPKCTTPPRLCTRWRAATAATRAPWTCGAHDVLYFFKKF